MPPEKRQEYPKVFREHQSQHETCGRPSGKQIFWPTFCGRVPKLRMIFGEILSRVENLSLPKLYFSLFH
jgi:hypothetical protein